MFEKSVPDWLVGVWQRLSIEENGEKDTTTKVIWIQTNSCFGDIRIPAERPVMGTGEISLGSLPEPTAIALSHQAGFAGITRLQGDTCEWHRALDYRPFNGQFDVGTLHWEGDILIETGVDGSYKEEWQQVSTGPTTALTLLQGPARQAWFVMCGDAFIYGCDRRPSLPAAETLTTLLNHSLSDSKTLPMAQQAQYLDCELSFGYCQSGEVPWEIQLSTLPWKEGNSLWHTEDFALDQANGHLIQTSGEHPFIWVVQEGGQKLCQ